MNSISQRLKAIREHIKMAQGEFAKFLKVK